MSVSQKKAVFTIASKNYLSFARTLLHSVQHHNNNLDTFLLLADECDNYFDKLKEKFTVVESRELNLDNYEQMAFRYNIVEFNTALKPFFIDYLFKRGYEKIVYLDPDIMVFNRLDFIYDLLDQYSVILTPHLSRPLSENEQSFPPENMFLLAGVFNLGFIGMANCIEVKAFIRWWSRKCSTACLIDAYHSGYFVDQKWCTLLPGFLDSIYVLRHQGCNMAVWNLHEREIHNGIVNDRFPLVFYHFSGYSLDDIKSVTKNQSKYTMDSRPDLLQIFNQYSKTVVDNGHIDTKVLPYKYSTFDNGAIINTVARMLYDHVSIKYPYPFSTGKDSYYALLKRKSLLVVNSDKPSITLSNTRSTSTTKLDRIVLMKLFKIAAKILGPNRYSRLMDHLQQASDIRDQDYLIK